MSRIIYCKFLQCEAQGLEIQVYPGNLGKYIFENISKKAWIQWQNKQTMLINEKKLSMINIADRKILEQDMVNFLFKDQEINI